MSYIKNSVYTAQRKTPSLVKIQSVNHEHEIITACSEVH